MTAYAELAAASNFSFLRGASHPQDMVLAALLLGQSGIGIADRNTLAGVVRAWSALRELREDGGSTPQKVRQGGSPGEIGYVVTDVKGRVEVGMGVRKDLAAIEGTVRTRFLYEAPKV